MNETVMFSYYEGGGVFTKTYDNHRLIYRHLNSYAYRPQTKITQRDRQADIL